MKVTWTCQFCYDPKTVRILTKVQAKKATHWNQCVTNANPKPESSLFDLRKQSMFEILAAAWLAFSLAAGLAGCGFHGYPLDFKKGDKVTVKADPKRQVWEGYWFYPLSEIY